MTPLPPAPSRLTDPVNFAAETDTFLNALPTFVTEANALQQDVTTKQQTASVAAQTATDKAGIATTRAGEASSSATAAHNSELSAAASAANAAALAGAFIGTSTSSVTIGTGNKSFATQLGEQYTAGIFMTAISQADNSKIMFGQVVSYDINTGALVINVTYTNGGGTFSDWNLSLVGPQGPQGPAGTVPAGKIFFYGGF